MIIVAWAWALFGVLVGIATILFSLTQSYSKAEALFGAAIGAILFGLAAAKLADLIIAALG